MERIFALRRIACLHTAESNIQVFDDALATSGLTDVVLRHVVRADLLAAAEQTGGLTPIISRQTGQVLRELCDEADAVLLTCSTLGPAAEAVAPNAAAPILRVDAALAADAVKGGGSVAVFCAVETTVEPTRLLFERAAQATGAKIAMHLVPGAWKVFKAGDRDRYLGMIAQAADDAAAAGATQVALAQASMADAADLATGHQRPLTSPTAGLMAAVKAAHLAERVPVSSQVSKAP